MKRKDGMIQSIEFTNRPPTVKDIPEFDLWLLARGLVSATRRYKEQQAKEKSDEQRKATSAERILLS